MSETGWKIPFGLDNPRRIAYQTLLSAFGVAFLLTEPARVGGVDTMTGSFKLIDDSTFEGGFPCFDEPLVF